MKPSDRVILNTSAQYIKTIINVVLSMYSTRLILSVLGASDYGIYTLVAGVVSMLSFLSNSFVVSTQRFLSYNMGKGDQRGLSSLFNDCVTVHVLIGLFMSILLTVLTPVVFNCFITIPADRIEAAKDVYWMVIAMLFLTIASSPFRAALFSHEDIVFISAIDVLDGILKVLLALWLSVISFDKLLGYGFAMFFVQFFSFSALIILAVMRYDECKCLKIRRISPCLLKELLPFVGWTAYSQACVIGRTQGVAVLLNRFVSLVANASFGIALQLLSFISFISSSVLNALQPPMVKAEGSGNREKLIELSAMSSKVAFLLLSIIAVPACFYIPELLDLWLDDVPQYASFFCIMVFIASLLDTSTIGLGIANQAIGNIRNYSIIVNTTKLLTLIPVWISLKHGWSLIYLAFFFCGIEFLSALLRLPYLRSTAGLSIRKYLKEVYLRILAPFLVYSVMLWMLKYVLSFNLLLSVTTSMVVYLLTLSVFSLSSNEKLFVRNFIQRIVRSKVDEF